LSASVFAGIAEMATPGEIGEIMRVAGVEKQSAEVEAEAGRRNRRNTGRLVDIAVAINMLMAISPRRNLMTRVLKPRLRHLRKMLLLQVAHRVHHRPLVYGRW
jgi:hypothetical protein